MIIEWIMQTKIKHFLEQHRVWIIVEWSNVYQEYAALLFCIFKMCLDYDTVEPRYNEVLGTMKIALLYQVSHYIRVKKTKKYKEVGPAELPCYKRVLLYPTSL